jgi:hypothetical protein
VRLTSAQAGHVLGTERPVLAGAPVRVERQGADEKWARVAGGAVDATGRFDVPVALAPGTTYRAVVTPGHGYWRGVSAPLTAGG